jgi:hypothetical protein
MTSNIWCERNTIGDIRAVRLCGSDMHGIDFGTISIIDQLQADDRV